MLKSKNPCGFVTQTFKVGITNPRGFFYLSNFYLVNLISQPLLLQPLLLRNQLYYIKVAQIKKSSRICYTSFKSFSNKSARIFWFEQLLFNKVDFRASDFGAALQLQIEAKRKMLGWSVAFGVKSVEKHLIRRNFF